ncbi:hypothetical protein N781_15665 [Pontibacillus halophilus JSM 076056 = DSM 19796]|uniref:Uncharacterized protein n=1 Tax=Pontibacillus halophilus JSM 076056 = DSM 19796 TaxID=1385510 RepID=A0A0A5GNQ8_9BACI|nr:hypothetical protein [Pontibacillus halophilus]KGX92805.1 hypothetical protein N781_15665 [Pontibacillus halophilus JSM 076056 = DSM 19796]
MTAVALTMAMICLGLSGVLLFNEVLRARTESGRSIRKGRIVFPFAGYVVFFTVFLMLQNG